MENKNKMPEEVIEVLNKIAIINQIITMKDLSKEEAIWENSMSNSEHDPYNLSNALKKVTEKKTKSLTHLMLLYMPLADKIKDAYENDGKAVRLSDRELRAIAYEAISMEIALQKWFKPSKDIPHSYLGLSSALTQAAINAINKRIEKEKEEERTVEPLKISPGENIDGLTSSEIADKVSNFRMTHPSEHLMPAANGAFCILKNRNTKTALLNSLGIPRNGKQINATRKH